MPHRALLGLKPANRKSAHCHQHAWHVRSQHHLWVPIHFHWSIALLLQLVVGSRVLSKLCISYSNAIKPLWATKRNSRSAVGGLFAHDFRQSQFGHIRRKKFVNAYSKAMCNLFKLFQTWIVLNPQFVKLKHLLPNSARFGSLLLAPVQSAPQFTQTLFEP